MRRSDRERRRLAVAHALRNATRLLNLSDNELTEEPAVRQLAIERYGQSVMKEELALSDLVLASAGRVRARLSGDRRLERELTLLTCIIEGGSVQSASKQLGLSREHLSNTTWRFVTTWVLDEFEVAADTRRRDTAPTFIQERDPAKASAGRP